MCKHERLYEIMSHYEGGVEMWRGDGHNHRHQDIDGWCPDCGAIRTKEGSFIFPQHYLKPSFPQEALPACSGEGLHTSES